MPEDKEGESLEEPKAPDEEQEDLDSDEGQEDEEEFDAERAMATIKAQRASEQNLKKQLAAMNKKLAKFEKAEKERQRAEMTELEKAQDQYAELQAQNAETVTMLNELRLKQAFSRTAEDMDGVAFANPQAREDAFALMDLAELSINDEGQVDAKAMKKAIKALQESRPHLFVEEEQGGMGTPRRPARRLPAPEDKEERPLRPLVNF